MAEWKKGEEGYVLGWVVIMVMVLMILVTATLFASSAYYRQSLREYNDRQAYLTARSIAETAAADFTGDGSGELRAAILDEIAAYMEDGTDAEPGDDPDGKMGGVSAVNNRIPIPDIRFQLDSTMGDCTMRGYFIPAENCLMLTAAVKKDSSTEIITVYLQNDPESEEESWTVLGYERGEPRFMDKCDSVSRNNREREADYEKW